MFSKVYIKKLDALELDINNYSNTVGELAAVAQELLKKQHYDSSRVSQTQVMKLLRL